MVGFSFYCTNNTNFGYKTFLASNSKSEAGKPGARCCTSNNYVNLDKHSAVLFPFIFVIFNLVYWTYFVLI